MLGFWRLVTVLLIVGIVWAVSEYVSLQAAVILLAVLVGISDINTNERIDRISKALEMHSKKVFPEHWD